MPQWAISTFVTWENHPAVEIVANFVLVVLFGKNSSNPAMLFAEVNAPWRSRKNSTMRF